MIPTTNKPTTRNVVLFLSAAIPFLVAGVLLVRNDHLNNNERDSTFSSQERILDAERIVNGNPADEGEFPWFAALEPLVRCGGTLIAPNRVLTAAHCLTNNIPSAVRVGLTNVNNGEQKCVRCAVTHPEFFEDDRNFLYHDVAILKLEESSSITPIILNDNTDYPSEQLMPLTVMGLGLTRQGGTEPSDELLEVGTFFEPFSNCSRVYPGIEEGVHVCADVPVAGDCSGDSGGPLIDDAGTQIGIVSFGFGCASTAQDVYADVSGHYEWIMSQIVDEGCEEFPSGADGICDGFLIDTVCGRFNAAFRNGLAWLFGG